MERWCGRVALVTGASAGIGAEICRVLVKHEMTVVGCARDVRRIQRIAEEEDVLLSPGRLFAVKCDLSRESDILAMFHFIRSKFGRVDVCINNAGFSTNCSLLTGQTIEWRNMLEVNVLALCICTRESVKLMKERKITDGQIIHIDSMGGHRLPTVPMSGFSFYCGTKFMVRVLTEHLRKELKAENSRIRVASISPGLVETEFFSRMLDPETANKWFGSAESLKPGDIANAVVYILQSASPVEVNDLLLQPVELRM